MALSRLTSVKAAHTLPVEQSRLVLSERDFVRFVEIINDPSPPTPKLVQAMRDYEALRVAHPDRGL